MNSGLYRANVTCPICERSFPAVKVKATAYQLDHTDEDFCMHYTDLNPLLYEPWICDNCGYTEFGVSYDKISEIEKRKLQSFCLNKFVDDPNRSPFELTDFHKRVYGLFDRIGTEGERDNVSGIEAFKLLLSVLEARNAPYSARAKAVLRIAWIYRFMGDPLEMEHMATAAEYFSKAFETEDLEDGKFDSATCAYMVGEIERRLGKKTEAVEWFGRALIAAQKSDNKTIAAKTRDQIQEAKSGR